MVTLPTPEDVVKKVSQYAEAVIIFSFLDEKLTSMGISHELEINVESTSQEGSQVSPDFLILREEEIKDIIEHKAALSRDRELAEDTVEEVLEKYREVSFNGMNHDPKVTLMIPQDYHYMIHSLGDDFPSDLGVSAFSYVGDNLSLERFSEFETPDLNNLFDCGPYSCPRSHFSKHKFLKQEPEMVYTAFQVIQILRSFTDVKTMTNGLIRASKDVLLDRIQTFYPNWIRNVQQINSSRFFRALDFLEKIDFVEFDETLDEVRMEAGRGRRAGDLLKYLADKFCRIEQQKQLKKAKKAALPRFQETLERFMS